MNHETKVINKLIVDISHNDEKALEELFYLTKEKLYYIACKYLVDTSKADDVLSRAYEKIYLNSNKFNKKYNGFNWMYEIVKNLALDSNKEDLRNNHVEFNEDYHVSDKTANNLSRTIKINMALNSLEPLEKEIVILRIWENNKLKDIAKELDMPISSVHRTYKNALAKLKEMLSEMEGR